VLLVGPWRLPAGRAPQEEERRTFYVGITRARKTLAVFDRRDLRPSLSQELDGPACLRYPFTAETADSALSWLNYQLLSLEAIHLGYPGQLGPHHPVHRALTALQPGAKLTMRPLQQGGVGLLDASGTCVARLSRTAQANWAGNLASVREVRVVAIVHRQAQQDPDEVRREWYLVPEWEIPLVEIVFEDWVRG